MSRLARFSVGRRVETFHNRFTSIEAFREVGWRRSAVLSAYSLCPSTIPAFEWSFAATERSNTRKLFAACIFVACILTSVWLLLRCFAARFCVRTSSRQVSCCARSLAIHLQHKIFTQQRACFVRNIFPAFNTVNVKPFYPYSYVCRLLLQGRLVRNNAACDRVRRLYFYSRCRNLRFTVIPQTVSLEFCRSPSVASSRLARIMRYAVGELSFVYCR